MSVHVPHLRHVHCSLIKEFEQEARTDGMPAAELTSRKKGMVQQLNEYIAKKKELGSDIAGRKELIGAAKRGDAPKDYNSKRWMHPASCMSVLQHPVLLHPVTFT